MTTSTHHQSFLFFLPLAQQVALLKDDLLEAVDPLLDDPELIDLVRQCLATRHPQSTRTGRPGIAPDRLLRCCVLKHLKGWSFRDLERELCSNLVYRRFTHYDAEATPDFTSFSRLFALLGPSLTQKIHQRVVEVACESGRSGAQVKNRYHLRGVEHSLSDGQQFAGRRHPCAQPQPDAHCQRVQERSREGGQSCPRREVSSAGDQPCRQEPDSGEPAEDEEKLPAAGGPGRAGSTPNRQGDEALA